MIQNSSLRGTHRPTVSVRSCRWFSAMLISTGGTLGLLRLWFMIIGWNRLRLSSSKRRQRCQPLRRRLRTFASTYGSSRSLDRPQIPSNRPEPQGHHLDNSDPRCARCACPWRRVFGEASRPRLAHNSAAIRDSGRSCTANKSSLVPRRIVCTTEGRSESAISPGL